METFSALLAICEGNSPVPGEFPAQRPVTRIFDFFFDLCLNKRLSKQPSGWRFETPSWSLWRQCNAMWSHHICLEAVWGRWSRILTMISVPLGIWQFPILKSSVFTERIIAPAGGYILNVSLMTRSLYCRLGRSLNSISLRQPSTSSMSARSLQTI